MSPSGARAPGGRGAGGEGSFLAGLRVVELARSLPAAWTGGLLADLGADVVKIEDPKVGDLFRRSPPMVNGVGALHWTVNRNKRSAVLDLKHPPAREALLRLVERADILVEGFSPGTLERLGLGPGLLQERNPRLVLVSNSAYRDPVPGHDIDVAAEAGLLGLDAEPRPPSVTWAPALGSLWAVAAVLAALRERDRTGEGTHLQLNLFDCVRWALLFPASFHFATGRSPAPGESGPASGHPGYGLYKCQDGRWLALGSVEPDYWRALCDAIGRPDLKTRAFSRKPEEVRKAVADGLASRPAEEWARELRARGAVAGLVKRMEEALADISPAGGVRSLPTPVGSGPGRTAPAHGENTREVLAELGYGEREAEEILRGREP
ncbi:MAG: CaiB/BaiF CoA-transferase family protein [Halobacteria archaeon]